MRQQANGVTRTQRQKPALTCPPPKKKRTRSSADADNGLDAFSGQSRSTSFLLCNSNL